MRHVAEQYEVNHIHADKYFCHGHVQIRCWARAQCARHHMTQISFTRNAYTSSYSFRSLLGSGFAVLQIAVVVLTTAAALLAAMPSSALCRAKRAFVSVLLSVASMYGVSALVNRESEDKDVLRAYRQVIKKAHPDHGGDTEKFQRLQAAKEAWATQREKSPKVGAPSASADDLVLSTLSADGPSGGARVRGQSVLLTYSGT